MAAACFFAILLQARIYRYYYESPFFVLYEAGTEYERLSENKEF
jgi:hypothetical protein